LVESEVFKIFVRPTLELEKALVLLPKLTFEQMLERISKYFSFMGNISETQVVKESATVNEFAIRTKKMCDFLEKFREHVKKMEDNFHYNWENHKSLVKYF